MRFGVGTWILVLVASCLAAARQLEADSGDLLAINEELSNQDLSDLCRDVEHGGYWVTSRTLGQIFRLDDDIQRVPAEDIDNPHGSFNIFSNPVTTRGLAYVEELSSLVALGFRRALEGGGAGSFELRSVDRLGVPIGDSAIPLQAPDASAVDLHGLAWDPLDEALWTFDLSGQRALQFDLEGNFIVERDVSPIAPAGERFGQGITFELHPNGATGFLHVALGDVRFLGPNVIKRLTVTGFDAALYVPLPEDTGRHVLGFEMGEFAGDPVAVVVDRSPDSGSRILAVERSTSPPFPPSRFAGRLNSRGEVRLSWKNHGFAVGGVYAAGIQIRRNGQLLSSLPGSRTSFTDRNPPAGTVTYAITASDAGPPSERVETTVVAGSGGLMSWRPFPGASLHDICRNPDTGDFYATDPQAGRIYLLQPDLSPYVDGEGLPRYFDAPFAQPGGIAFFPEGDGGAGALMVVRLDGVLMRQVSLSGEFIDVGIPMNPPSGANVTSGLTYNPHTGLFTYVDEDLDLLVFINRNGAVSDEFPPVHPALTGPLHRGVAVDSTTGNLYSSVDGGSLVKELFAQGTPTSFEFGLQSLGSLAEIDDALGGTEVAANRLIVCSAENRALFEVLIAPVGGAFLRGDSNTSSQVDASDAIHIAEYLFVEGATPACLDAADSNDDGVIDISDPVYLLYFLFVGGDPPPPPYPDPGTDPTFLDALDCSL